MMKRFLIVFLLVTCFTNKSFAVDQTVLDKTADSAPTADDILYTINDPGGTPADRKVTLGNAAKAMTSTNLIDTADIIYETELDTFSELQSQIADKTLINTADAATITGDYDFGGGTLQIPNGTSLPGTCDVGDQFMDTDATSGQRHYLCESANTWALQGDGGAGGGLASTDIDTYSELNTIVADVTLTHNGLIDTFSELDAIVADKALVNKADGAVWTGTHDFGGATVEVPNSTSLPGTCTVGQIYMDTDATSGQRIYACESTNTWALQGDGGAGGGYTNLTQFVDQTAWRVFYSNTDGDITELALGADGTFLKSNGATSAPSFSTPAGSGDVSKVGTPVDNQVGVWTGDGTLEGSSNFVFDGTNVGIGTSVPASKVDVVTSAESVFSVGSDGRITRALRPRISVMGISGPEGNELNDGNMANANGLWTYNGNQYAGYCSDTGTNDGKLVLAKRSVGSEVWTTHEYTSMTCLTNADNHRGVNIAVDDLGIIHVWRNMHATTLVYNRSTVAEDITALSGSTSTMLGTNESQATYPIAWADSTGKLWFTFRDGTSPNANQYMYEYDSGTTTWTAATGTGTAGLMINGKVDTDGVYLSYPEIDANDDFHWTYTWREDGNGNTAFNVSYLKYDTSANAFLQADGTSQTMPVTQANANVIETIAQPSGLIDAQSTRSICTDTSGNIHVGYVKNDANSFTQVYYTKYTSSWSTPVALTSTNTVPRLATGVSEFPATAPVVLCGDNDDVFLFWYDVSLGDGIQVASSKNGGSSWQTGTIYSGPLGSFRFNVDYTRWDDSNIFNWLFQYIGDQEIAETQSPMYVGEWNAYDSGYADTIVRQGITSPYDVTIKSTDGDVRLVAKDDGSVEIWGADASNLATQIASFNSTTTGPSWITGNVGIGTTLPLTEFHVGTGVADEAVGADDAYFAGDIEIDGVLYLSDGTAISGSGDLGAGGGDNITVNGTAIDTTAAFTSLLHDIDFTVSDGGAGGPDSIFADINWSNINEIAVDNINWDTFANKTDGYALIWEDDISNPQWTAVAGGSGDITDVYNCSTGDCNSIALTDGDLLNMSAVNASTTTEGLIVPQNTDCSAATAEGQVCWDTDGDDLYIGDGSSTVQINGVGGSASLNERFWPHQAYLVHTAPAGIDSATTMPKLLFDADAAESASWLINTQAYAAGTVTADVYFSMAAGEANEVQFRGYMWCYTPGTDSADIDTESYDTANEGTPTTVAATAGRLYKQSITMTNKDSMAAGDVCMFKLDRDATDATNDDATGDAEVRLVVVHE